MTPAADLAACAEREAKMRRRVYPRWVESGRMTAAQAEREIAMMEEIAGRMRAEAEKEAANHSMEPAGSRVVTYTSTADRAAVRAQAAEAVRTGQISHGEVGTM